MTKQVYYKQCDHNIYKLILNEFISHHLLSPVDNIIPIKKKLLNYSIVLSHHSGWQGGDKFLYVIIYVDADSEIYKPIKTIKEKYTFEDLGTVQTPDLIYLGPLTNLNTLHALFFRTPKQGQPYEVGNLFLLYYENTSKETMLRHISNFKLLTREKKIGKYGFRELNENSRYGDFNEYQVPELAAAEQIYKGMLSYIEVHGFEKFMYSYHDRCVALDEHKLTRLITF